jgi:uncharacterized membrane protein
VKRTNLSNAIRIALVILIVPGMLFVVADLVNYVDDSSDAVFNFKWTKGYLRTFHFFLFVSVLGGLLGSWAMRSRRTAVQDAEHELE